MVPRCFVHFWILQILMQNLLIYSEFMSQHVVFLIFFLFEMLFWKKKLRLRKLGPCLEGVKFKFIMSHLHNILFDVWGIPNLCKSVKIVKTILLRDLYQPSYYPRVSVFEQDPVYCI